MLKAMTEVPRRLPRITNPLSIPVEGVDDHLPAVPPTLLAPASLRQRFAAPPVWQPESEGDGKAFLDREPAHASVLVPLVMREGGLTVLLTRRTEHLRDHAGQISFPGGRAEDHDHDAVATALREAEEEVGLAPRLVEVIGQLPHYTTVTRFVVTPVVGLVQPGLSLKPDPSEVAEAFEVPLAFLMTPAHHRRHSVVVDGHPRRFLSMPWTGPDATGRPRDYFIWGATAAMLRNFYRFLSA
jgi:8-oxo-dGTP pyrophosphatase MutT (NUDIX family)